MDRPAKTGIAASARVWGGCLVLGSHVGARRAIEGIEVSEAAGKFCAPEPRLDIMCGSPSKAKAYIPQGYCRRAAAKPPIPQGPAGRYPPANRSDFGSGQGLMRWEAEGRSDAWPLPAPLSGRDGALSGRAGNPRDLPRPRRRSDRAGVARLTWSGVSASTWIVEFWPAVLPVRAAMTAVTTT